MNQLSRSIFALIALAPFADAALEAYLPAETFGIVQVGNLPKTRKSIESHPIATGAWKAIDSLAGSMAKEVNEVLSDKNKEKAEKLLAAMTGEVLFAVVHTEKPVEGHQPLDFILLADTDSTPDTIAALLKDLELHQPTKADEKKSDDDEGDDEEPEIKAGEETYRDLTLHTLYVIENDKEVVVSGWTIVNKTFVFASAPNVLKELVDARLDGRKDNFASTPVFKTNAKALAESDVRALVNIPLVVREGRKALFADKTDNGAMGINFEQAFDSLALDNFSAFTLGVSVAPAESRAVSKLAWEENKGLARIFAASRVPGGELDLNSIPEGVLSATVAKADISRTLAEYISLIKGAVPMLAPMLDMQIDSMKAEQGLDLRAGILENFGDRMAVYQDAIPAPRNDEERSPNDIRSMISPTVVMVALKDEAKFNAFVETALGQVTQTAGGSDSIFDEHEVLGVKVRTVKASDKLLIRYAIHRGSLYLALAEGDLLNRVLAQSISPKNGVAELPAFRKALTRLQKNPDAVSFTDMELYLKQIARAATQTQSEKDKAEAARLASVANGYIGVGTTVTGEKSFESVSVLVPGKSDERR